MPVTYWRALAQKRLLGHAGGIVAARVLPLAAIATSALSNAAVTYAIGKRAQAVTRLRDRPIRAMPDVVRAFTGIDERRVYAWSVAAVKDTVGLIGKSFSRFALTSMRKGAKKVLLQRLIEICSGNHAYAASRQNAAVIARTRCISPVPA